QWHLAVYNTSAPGASDQSVVASNGQTNYMNYILGINPNSGGVFTPQLSLSSSGASYTFSTPLNLSATVEISPDLVNWSLWDVPGNDGMPLPGGPVTISGTTSGNAQFFR